MEANRGKNGTKTVTSADGTVRIDCYSPFMIITNGIWQGDNPLDYALPLFLVQLLIISLTTRAVHLLVRPLSQPMVMAEILAGVLLGPSVTGKFFPGLTKRFFPPRSVSTMVSMANLGLLYSVFMVGVEMDLNILHRAKKKVLALGTLTIAVPFALSLPAAYLLRGYLVEQENDGSFYVYLAIAFSVTSFPVLARILTELKLLSAEMGRLTLLSSVANDLLSWAVLSVVSAFTGDRSGSHYTLLCSIGYVLVCVFLVQPLLKRLVAKTPPGETMSDVDLGLVIMGVLVAGFVTDAIGVHSTFGAFVYGLVFPHGPHGTALVERLQHFVLYFLAPVYFGRTGFRTDLSKIVHSDVIAALSFIFVLSSVGKVVTTTLVTAYLGMPVSDGITMGFLMNSQGLAEAILLDLARDKDLVEPETFAVVVVMSVLTTAVMAPMLKAASKPMRRLAKYKRRTVMHGKPNAELRMLACVHSTINVSSVLSLVDLSAPTSQSPVFVSALHLIELAGRESAMLIVHDPFSKSSVGDSFRRNQAQTERIVSAFQAYQQRSVGVSLQCLTAVAPYPSMHHDICNVAAESRAAVIVLPFDGSQTVTGLVDSDSRSIRAVNRSLLLHAPCSVAILVDRGLNAVKAARNAQRVVVLFFGGPDDREALAIASRMAEHPNVTLTLVRFVQSQQRPPIETNDFIQRTSMINDADRDQVVDDECIGEFHMRNAGSKSVGYMERAANSSEEMVAMIKSLNYTHALYVVGMSQRRPDLMKGMIEWAEYPELGAVGDLLASTDVDDMLSVLVVQQYTARVQDDDGDDEAEAMLPPVAPAKCVSSANRMVGGVRRDCNRGV